jgi:tetratricopeptide (TPR) repeat protein
MNTLFTRFAPAALVILSLGALGCQQKINYLLARYELNKGVRSFAASDYPTAITFFEKALTLDPELNDARSYRAYSFMMQFIPGHESAENDRVSGLAIEGFEDMLDRSPNDHLAVSSLASLYFNMKEFDKSVEWHNKRIKVLEDQAAESEDGMLDPVAAESYYTIGVISWGKSYEPRLQLRADQGMNAGDPGPLKKGEERDELAGEAIPTIQSGMKALDRALEINPDYADAMVYMNLLYREKADFADSTDEYQGLLAQADDWVQKTLDTKKRINDAATIDQFHTE